MPYDPSDEGEAIPITEEELAGFDGDYEATDEPDLSGGRGPLPDGTYYVVVDSAELKRNRRGDPMLTLTLQVTDGPFKNRLIWRNDNINPTPISMKWLKHTCWICNVKEPPSALARDATLQRFLDVRLEVALKTTRNARGESNQNVYLNRRLGEGEKPPSAPPIAGARRAKAPSPSPAASEPPGRTWEEPPDDDAPPF